jgi:hypothetical protein
LFLDSGRDRELVIARLDEKGNPVATPDVEQLVAEFKRNNIGAWIPDPLVRLHRLDENDNSQMDFFVATLAQIARDANVAILAPHHFRKGGQGGDADAFRGASAVINAARAAVSLTRMTAEEASGVFKVPEHERWRYLRVENAKLNTAPPPEHAVWLRLVSVALPNGPGGEVGDKVQTVERWYPPSPFEALSMDGMVAALDEIEAGEDGEYFTARRGGKTTRWAGEVLQRHAQQPMSDAQAQGILRRWLESGLLINTTYKSVAQRKVRERVAVDQALKADLTRQTSGGSVSLD